MTTTNPRRFSARDLALIATFAGVMAALGAIPAFTPAGSSVPVTAQSMGPMLAGAIIGRRRGAASQLLFLALVAIGLPLLAGGRGGFSVFSGASVGYLVGFPVGAYVTGLITEWFGTPYEAFKGLIANLVGGIVFIYALGIPGMVWRAHLSWPTAFHSGFLFLPGDCAKAVIAAVVARGVHAAYPGLLPTRRRRTADETPAPAVA